MSITIDYAQFGTQTGDFPTAPAQPYQYSSIYNGITDLATDDRVIIFSGLPSGLRIASNPTTTQPYDSVYMDIQSYNDYLFMSGVGNNQWSDGSVVAAYTSGGFWAIGDVSGNSPGCILTGLSGSASSSILDIEFTGIELTNITFDSADWYAGYSLDRIDYYTFNVAAPSGSNVIFTQSTNDSWYPTHIVANSGDVFISGSSFAGSGDSILLTNGFSGYISWENNQLVSYDSESVFPAPAPFNQTTLYEGYGWSSTVANELLSNYSVIANNSGNSGIGIIQLNQQAANGEQFSDLIPPLRKLHVAFTIG